MPRDIHKDNDQLFRAVVTISYPGRPEAKPHVFYFGPYQTEAMCKSIVKREKKKRLHNWYGPDRTDIKVDSEIEVADISWRPYHDRA